MRRHVQSSVRKRRVFQDLVRHADVTPVRLPIRVEQDILLPHRRRQPVTRIVLPQIPYPKLVIMPTHDRPAGFLDRFYRALGRAGDDDLYRGLEVEPSVAEELDAVLHLVHASALEEIVRGNSLVWGEGDSAGVDPMLESIEVQRLVLLHHIVVEPPFGESPCYGRLTTLERSVHRLARPRKLPLMTSAGRAPSSRTLASTYSLGFVLGPGSGAQVSKMDALGWSDCPTRGSVLSNDR